MKQIAELTGKPILIGEFHFGVPGRGLAASLVQVRDQRERGRAYRYYVENAVRDAGSWSARTGSSGRTSRAPAASTARTTTSAWST